MSPPQAAGLGFTGVIEARGRRPSSGGGAAGRLRSGMVEGRPMGWGRVLRTSVAVAVIAGVCAADAPRRQRPAETRRVAIVGSDNFFIRTSFSAGKVEVKEASVEAIPYDDGSFDGATAIESIYFWPNIADNFKEVARVLKVGGVFMVCNEAQGPEGLEKIIKRLKINIYTGEEIKGLMERAGFSHIEIDKHKKGRWLCVTGKK